MSFSLLFPFHISMLTGCDELTDRAALTTLISTGSVIVPKPPFVGSLYKSQNKMRGSFLNLPITACTYAVSLGCVVESITILWPGLGDHAQAYQPTSGSGCLPIFGSLVIPKEQSSNNAGTNFM